MFWSRRSASPRRVLVVVSALTTVAFLRPALAAEDVTRSHGAGVSQGELAAAAQSLSAPALIDQAKAALAEAAEDPRLLPWQRAFMRELGGGGHPDLSAGTGWGVSPGASLDVASGPQGSWRPIPSPLTRREHTAIYDPVRDRMVVFGGWDGSSYLNNTWTLSLSGTPTWSELKPSGALPSGRRSHTAIYDPLRDRMVIFGGNDGSRRNDTWALSLCGSLVWSELAPSGSPPSARHEHAAVYDPVRDRMVVFGGFDGSRRNDTWALSLSGSLVWSELASSGSPPSARSAHTAIYDPVRDQMVVFGGFDGSRRNDTWVLPLSGTMTWSQLAPAGPPLPRYEHTAIYDPVCDRMVVFGGSIELGSFNDTWALSLSGTPIWQEIVEVWAGPYFRYGHAAIYDPLRDRMVAFGGVGTSTDLNDTWSLALSGTPAWTELQPTGAPPPARRGHAAIYDPGRQRMVVWGGGRCLFEGDDTWVLSLSGPLAWKELVTSGTLPSAREEHTAIYDPVRDRMVIFGGWGGLDDTWALSFSGPLAWSQLVTSGTPPSRRERHSAIYDPVRDRMVIFGGYECPPPHYCDDTWALSLSGTPTWTRLMPGGAPPCARAGHSAIYDPVRDRMVIYGGESSSELHLDDTWALSLSEPPGWSEITPLGVLAPGRQEHAAIYDGLRDRMVVFGGAEAACVGQDTWALSLSGTLVWIELAPAGSPPPQRQRFTAIHDELHDRMVIFGGFEGSTYANDAWALVWGGRGAEPEVLRRPTRPVTVESPQPNPSRSTMRIEFTLSSGGPTRVEVMDVGGRRVRLLMESALSSGAHHAAWDGKDDGGGTASPGVYFIRVQAPGGMVSRKVIRL